MDSTLVLILFSALLLLLYAKWLLLLLALPLLSLEGYYRNHPSTLAKLLAAPSLIVERFTRSGMSRFFILNTGKLPSLFLRKQVYRLLGAHIGKHVVFHYNTEIRFPHNLHVGDGSIIGDNCLLAARWGVEIKRNVNISSRVSVYSAHHDHRDPYFRSLLPSAERRMKVTICDRAWIGPNAIILPGVTIGEGAVCCAGCVVTRDVPPFAIVAGVPARQIGERSRDLRYEFKGKACWFY